MKDQQDFALGIAKAKNVRLHYYVRQERQQRTTIQLYVKLFIHECQAIVLTADRPHELRDVGAPQAMNQFNLYGTFVKQFTEMALPEASEAMYHYAQHDNAAHDSKCLFSAARTCSS